MLFSFLSIKVAFECHRSGQRLNSIKKVVPKLIFFLQIAKPIAGKFWFNENGNKYVHEY